MSLDGIHLAPRGRDWLREAFLIAQGRSTVPVEEAHLRAIIEHCRVLTSAAMELPTPPATMKGMESNHGVQTSD